MEKCFVIQPFDKGKFDKRYKDIFKPAITDAGLSPYRVDEDKSVRIPIENIEKEIRDSAICFADITTDNPNVWYELGYAFACGKDVVMTCDLKERTGNFPFDIQHRHIITYSNESLSDFDNLKSDITNKVKALLSTEKKINQFKQSNIALMHGLDSKEITTLTLLMENQFTDYDTTSIFQLKEWMERAGYTQIATRVSLFSLEKKRFISVFMEDDFNNGQFPVARVEKSGIDWIMNNQNLFEFEIKTDNSKTDEILPF